MILIADNDEFDIEFLLAARGGDSEAFSSLYDRHGPTVLRYAWSQLGSRVAAEDCLQDTFVTAWEKRRKASIVDESLLPWLLSIARNHVRNQLRLTRRRKTDAADLRAVAGPGDQEAHEDAMWIREEIAKLSDADRRVCQLCLIEGMAYAEAAELLDTTASAIGKRLQRARARLRRGIAGE